MGTEVRVELQEPIVVEREGSPVSVDDGRCVNPEDQSRRYRRTMSDVESRDLRNATYESRWKGKRIVLGMEKKGVFK